MSFQHQFLSAKKAAHSILSLSTAEKNAAIEGIAEALENNVDQILEENKKDIAIAETGPMIDRLMLTEDRIKEIAIEVRSVALLEDQVGKTIDESKRPNGLKIARVRVPLGVVGMIYESRPNVTVDASVLAFKSGNAIVLKGGKEAIHSNRILVSIMRKALEEKGITPEIIQFIDSTDRAATAEMLEAKGMIDILIPRGGRGLIDFVHQNAKIPAIETGASVVHTFVDSSAKLKESLQIVVNEKVRRVSVCNALDTLLLHEQVAPDFLPLLAEDFIALKTERGLPAIKIHADEASFMLLSDLGYSPLSVLYEGEYDKEWLGYEMSVRIVKNIDEAIAHIQQHSLGHSECICTEDKENAEQFLRDIDAACVYHNASTTFSDGSQFGLGAEIGISTQKLHTRGPFALEGLTTYKWIIRGEGQIRD
jgi:glutamate-5-semialdehyde dehydrogenase